MSNPSSSGRCILVFVKLPEAGKVKARLSEDLDENTACSLYKVFVLDLLDTLKKGHYIVRICFYPPGAEEKLSDWLGKDLFYIPQTGKDLGARMENAFIDIFSQGYSEVLLIGSDLPDLPGRIIEEAFEGLKSNGAVVGPAFDGGYYLIGFRKDTFLPEIFQGIHWGTNTVFAKTMEMFKRSDYRVHVLTKWWDVDGIADLKALFERNRHTEFLGSRTMIFLTEHFRSIFKK
jgi:rSAM/selenodomain-associated transferase 1